MKTTATNRKIRVLVTALKSQKLIPRPEFQRRLVWSNKHKLAFIQTVLLDYPFPEIYIAAGEVDVNTGEGKEMLVDGQQRVTTLFQYFTGDPELKLDKATRAYVKLNPEEKTRFLEYEVVVRDLGAVSLEEIKEVFRRINSTKYALTAMEIQNARFDGEFKQCGEEIASHEFFEAHRVFSVNEIKRMQDTKYCLTLMVTLMSGYFNRDDDLEEYLSRFNDEFSEAGLIKGRINSTLKFIDDCKFHPGSRIWKKADLFTAIVEISDLLHHAKKPVNHRKVSAALQSFYDKVDSRNVEEHSSSNAEKYYLATVQASNDKSSRVVRGDVVKAVLLSQ